MIVAHLPAGYLIARAWRRIVPGIPFAGLVRRGMIGAVLPDIDLLWAIFVDHWTVNHHRYFTHWPLFWIVAIGLMDALRRRKGWNGHGLAVLAVAVASHLFLDWIVSDLWWAMPFSEVPSHLVTVEPRYRPWYLNFVLHPVCLLDVGIAVVGILAAMTDGIRRHGRTRLPVIRQVSVAQRQSR